MVRYESEFHADIMIRLRELRADGDLCDVTLTVRKNKIQAHRCVLAAGSEYFHTLFLGQFKEASMQNIDLSEVTNDGKDLEQVIDFMYSGEIDINDDNVEALVRLSAYLLMESLKEYCVKYMEEHANLRACLNHYFCCVEHSLDEAEEEKKLMVASRFHDYFVYEDNSDLTLDEVKLLLSNNMFQHCTVSSILQFLFRWLSDEITDQHVAVVSDILDIAESKIMDSLSDQQKCDSRQMIVKIEEKLCNSSSCDVRILLKKLQKIETFPKREAESQSCPVPSGGSRSANMGSPGSNYEEVIVTLSPKQCLVDEFNRQKLRLCRDCEETAFSLCCYIPCTKTWYHIQDFENEKEIAALPKTDDHEKHCKMTSFLFKEELVLIWATNLTKCLKVYFYNLRSKSWREVDLPELEREHDDNLWTNLEDYCLVNDNKNSCLYLILRMGVEDNYDSWHSEEEGGEFFEGLRLRENGSVERLFETSVARGRLSTPSELNAKVSSVSNELIFTCGQPGNRSKDGMTYAYIVNLNNEKPTAVDILQEFEELFEGLADVQIFQTPTHFYILSDKTEAGPYRLYRSVNTVYEYEYHSETLTEPLDYRSIHLKLNQPESKEEEYFHKSMHPCLGEYTVSHMKSLWSFEGDRNFFSGLHQVKMDDSGSLTQVKHTPPPFSCVTGMAAGILPADLVAQWTGRPMARFLHRAYRIGDD